MNKTDLLKHRGLTETETAYILDDHEPHFNIFNPPRFGPDRCFLLFFPDRGSYFLGHGDKPAWAYVGDRGTNYAVIWDARGNYKQLEAILEKDSLGMEMYGIEFRV